MEDSAAKPPVVLIAEDEDLMREALRRYLEKEYRVVAVVTNGKEAVETVQQHRPDIALMDISMPVMDGLDAAEKISAAAPEVKVIMMTGHAEPAYVEEAFRRGAKGYVLKGRIAELRQAIRTVLGGGVYRPDWLRSPHLGSS